MTRDAPDPLSLLALRHGTDKYGDHLYTHDYHRLFADRRARPLRLLEIGVGGYGRADCGGQSLAMWAEYFPQARIVGLDLHPKTLRLPPRVAVRQGSQSDPAVLDRLWREDGPFDIVIDDGSHQVADVLASFHQLYPRLPADGIYVVEDTQTALWPEYGGAALGEGSIFDVVHLVALAMHREEMAVAGHAPAHLPYGDITRAVRVLRNLVVFERGDNTYPANYRFDLEHPEVRAVRAQLEDMLRDAPSRGAWLTRSTLELRAGQAQQAAISAATGLAAYPGDPDLTAALGRAVSPPPTPAAQWPAQDAPPALPVARSPAGVLAPAAEDGFWAVRGRNPAAAALAAPPRLSVFVCAYRRYEMIPVLLHAMQAQTLRNFVVVIMHDGKDAAMLDLLHRCTLPLAIPVEYRFSAVRHADYGHTLRDRAIGECASEFLLLTNDDNYYVPPFVQTMFEAIDAGRLDLAMCNMVHSHVNAGGREGPPYSPFATRPARLHADIGCFIVRTDCARRVGFRDRTHDGDGTFIDDLMALGPEPLAWGKVERTLFVHN